MGCLTCAFPGCSRSALTGRRRADLDHLTPHPRGPTCEHNLIPLCRRHHNLKTHARWTPSPGSSPGELTWTSPHGRTHRSRPLLTDTGPAPPGPDDPPF